MPPTNVLAMDEKHNPQESDELKEGELEQAAGGTFISTIAVSTVLKTVITLPPPPPTTDPLPPEDI